MTTSKIGNLFGVLRAVDKYACVEALLIAICLPEEMRTLYVHSTYLCAAESVRASE
jgi:hypothetical protein